MLPPPPAVQREGVSSLPRLLLTVGLAFIAGVLVAAAAAALWFGLGSKRMAGTAAPFTASRPVRTAPVASLTPIDADRQRVLGARLAGLEARMARLLVEADMAAGKAGRAEQMLTAFAARRALDSGRPLGYVEGQLRRRFGDAQPRAVATIINAGREPVTLADLQGGLETLRPQLTGAGPDARWFDALRRELSGLIVFRRAGTPSTQPETRLLRARRYLAGGRVEAALAEVEAMPGRAAADRWAQMARRYLEAHRALDLIETAAMLDPPGPAPAAAPRDLPDDDAAPPAAAPAPDAPVNPSAPAIVPAP